MEQTDIHWNVSRRKAHRGSLDELSTGIIARNNIPGRHLPRSPIHKAEEVALGGSIQPRAARSAPGGFVGSFTIIPAKRMNAITFARPTFVPWDIEVARLNFGANCG